MPPVWNARRTSCPTLSFKRAQIPNFWMRSIPKLWTRPMSSFWTYLFAVCQCHTLPAANGVICCAMGMLRCLRRAHSIGWGYRVHTCVMAIGADFKMYLLRQFCLNRVEFFLQYTGDTDTKNDGPEFSNSNYVIFENFLKFSKRRRMVPLQPIWTIMVTAKLDQSRVLVTKFHQNLSTLKGTSAGQRHTHTHTHRQTDKLGWK